MQNARLLIVFLALLCTTVCAFNIYVIEEERKEAKNDLVELSKIKYGLFNVDEWKNIFSEILSKKAEALDFTEEEMEGAKEKISAFLYKAIEDMEEEFQYEQSKSLGGYVKIGVANITDLFGEIKTNVPEYTDDILTFLREPSSREAIKSYINKKLSEYADETFSEVDYSIHEKILKKHNFQSHADAVSGLEAQVAKLDVKLKKYLYAGLMVGFLCAFGILFTPLISRWEYVMYTFITLGLLAAGLILPMIEIDARIAQLSFSVLGEQISFSDQVLYYKSKSIIEVVKLLLTQGKPDVLFVGVLVLTFSVIFPVTKLLISLVYIFFPAVEKRPFVRFMVFRTGKWSMADVMVVAIFMSYIGFSGILTEQLGQLEGLSPKLDVLTTNRSSLQDGFFMFTSFVILSLLIAYRQEFKATTTTPAAEPATETAPVDESDSAPAESEAPEEESHSEEE